MNRSALHSKRVILKRWGERRPVDYHAVNLLGRVQRERELSGEWE